MVSPLHPARRAAISSFIVMDVMDEAMALERSGAHVIHLEVGQPSTGAPRLALDAAHRALEGGTLGYTSAVGDTELRERIARHYREKFSCEVDPRDVVLTTGASGAFVLAFLAAFDVGARVACPVPGYPCYRNILAALGLVPVDMRVWAGSGYQVTREHLRTLEPKPAGLILASPANPTGSVIDRKTMDSLIAYCRDEGIVPIVDEIYQGLVYGGEREFTALGLWPGAWVINSFSKYYSMTGWRLGWLVAPPEYRRAVEVLAQNLAICPPAIAQKAALFAFDATSELEGHRARYDENRLLLLAALKEVGIENLAPAQGAFYLYADFSAFTDDTREFCREMLADIFVATTPGVDFDPEDGDQMIRFSYCRSTEEVREACRRLVPYLRQRPRRK